MATTNYYSTLGIDKKASPDEVKKAYRKLAHQYHPDKNHGNKEAESKFKEVSNAYEVIGDPQKRAQYDQFGVAGANMGGGAGGGNGGMGGFGDFAGGNFNFNDMNFGGVEEMFETFFGGNPFGGGGQNRGGQTSTRKKGVDLEVELSITIQEAANGVKKTFKHKHAVKCESCDGKGHEQNSAKKKCVTCNGRRSVYQRVQTIFGTVQQEITCPSCNGIGETFDKICKVCHGKGHEAKIEEISLDIPVGINTGQRIKVEGKGEIGYAGSEPGDLFVLINVKIDKKLERQGMDIFSVVEVDFLDLLIGTNKDVETVWGNVEIKIPPLTDPSKELRLRDHGMPKLNNSNVKGDHHLKIKVKMPTNLTNEQIEAIKAVKNGNKK
jgi:molecular chaperone DnaJ